MMPGPTTTGSDAYANLGQYQTAINDYTMAIQIHPDYSEAYINRGATYIKLSQYQTAIAYDNLGQYQQALLDLNTAIQFDPDDAWAHHIRAFVYRNLGRAAYANSDDAKACSLDSSYC